MKCLYNLSRIVRWALSTIEHLTSGFLQIWKWIPSRLNMSWNDLFKNSFPLSVRTQTGRHRIGFKYLGVVTALPVLLISGMNCKNLEKHLLQLVDIWRRRYICWGPGPRPDHIPTRHLYYSQCRGSREYVFAPLCNVYASCFNSHALISAGAVFCLLVLSATAFPSFAESWKQKALKDHSTGCLSSLIFQPLLA